jgi:hypothetical protein
LQAAIDYREGLVEEFLKKTPAVAFVQHSDWINFVQSILDRRKELINLLDFNSEIDEDDPENWD